LPNWKKTLLTETTSKLLARRAINACKLILCRCQNVLVSHTKTASFPKCDCVMEEQREMSQKLKMSQDHHFVQLWMQFSQLHTRQQEKELNMWSKVDSFSVCPTGQLLLEWWLFSISTTLVKPENENSSSSHWHSSSASTRDWPTWCSASSCCACLQQRTKPSANTFMTCSITILSDLSQHHFSGRNRYLPFLLLFPFKRLPAPVVYLVGVKDSPFEYKCMITTKESLPYLCPHCDSTTPANSYTWRALTLHTMVAPQSLHQFPHKSTVSILTQMTSSGERDKYTLLTERTMFTIVWVNCNWPKQHREPIKHHNEVFF
jgi:hypothetical protein